MHTTIMKDIYIISHIDVARLNYYSVTTAPHIHPKGVSGTNIEIPDSSDTYNVNCRCWSCRLHRAKQLRMSCHSIGSHTT